MKKLISDIHGKLALHYTKKARRHWFKFIGVKKSNLYEKSKLTKSEKNYFKDDVIALYEAYYGLTPGIKR